VRICSLLPAGTEIVAALGLAERLVGRSEECDWPPEVAELRVVTASRVDTTKLDGAAVDGAVRAALADGRSLYAVDTELVERLQPDVLLTQDTCAVCAVSSGEVRELCAVEAEIVSLDASTLAEIEASIEALAERLGVPERGAAVTAEMRGRIDGVTERVAGRPRPRVFLAEWLDPPFAPGHWLPEMVELAGGTCVLGRAGERSYPTTWDAVADAAPDVVIAAPCGYGAERSAAEAARVPLRARTVAVDANAYYARPAPRVADGVEQLAFLFHPGAVADPGLPWVEVRSSPA
jgi:iron complex transport system substrate-binding protein